MNLVVMSQDRYAHLAYEKPSAMRLPITYANLVMIRQADASWLVIKDRWGVPGAIGKWAGWWRIIKHIWSEL